MSDMESVDRAMKEIRETILKKSEDYAANGYDSTFRAASDVVGIHPYEMALAMSQIKLSRLSSIRKSKQANYESARDSVLDLASYTILALAMLLDGE